MRWWYGDLGGCRLDCIVACIARVLHIRCVGGRLYEHSSVGGYATADGGVKENVFSVL